MTDNEDPVARAKARFDRLFPEATQTEVDFAYALIEAILG